MSARKVRRRKRQANRPVDHLVAPVNLTYRDIVEQLDPGMLSWSLVRATPQRKAA